MRRSLGIITLRFVWMLLAMCASIGCASACPKLPSGSAVTWKKQVGPDFDVCYAVDSATNAQLFGVYLGFAPSFDPKNRRSLGRGIVAGRSVQWYRSDASDSSSTFAKQTIIELKKSPLSLAHIWITAKTGADAERAAKLLENISFDHSE